MLATAQPPRATRFWALAREPFRRDALMAAGLGWMLDSMDGIAGAAAPFLVGYLADAHGIAFGLLLTSSGFLAAGCIATRIRPERAAAT